jgi:hypothetical protein
LLVDGRIRIRTNNYESGWPINLRIRNAASGYLKSLSCPLWFHFQRVLSTQSPLASNIMRRWQKCRFNRKLRYKTENWIKNKINKLKHSNFTVCTYLRPATVCLFMKSHKTSWVMDIVSVTDPGCLSRVRIRFFLSRIQDSQDPGSASKN